MTSHSSKSPPAPSGPKYSARVALNCRRDHAPGPVLHALQELRSMIDDRLRKELGQLYEHHRAQSVGPDRLASVLALRPATPAEAIRTAGLAAATLVEVLTDAEAALDLSGIALVVRAEAD